MSISPIKNDSSTPWQPSQLVERKSASSGASLNPDGGKSTGIIMITGDQFIRAVRAGVLSPLSNEQAALDLLV